MELRHLRYFIAVAEEMHFGRGARRVNIAQPALTRQIRNLESEIGFDLFERLPRGIRLTAAGASFLADTQKLLKDVTAITERARLIDRGNLGSIRVGFSGGASWDGIMPDAFNRFRQDFPNVEIHIQQMRSLEQLRALQEERIDAGFLYNLPNTASEFEKRVVGGCEIVLALPKSHRLATRDDIVLADLRDEPFVWPERGGNPVYHDMLVAACAARGLTPHVIQEMGDESITINLIATGGLVGLVTSATYARCPPQVVLKKVADLSLELHLEFAWRRDDRAPALLAFVDTVTTLAAARLGAG